MALVPTLLVATLSGSSTGLDRLNQVLNLLQSVQLPFALLPVLVFNASARLMGKHVNSRATNVAAGAISLAVVGVNMAGLYAFLEAALEVKAAGWWVLAGCVAAVYLSFIVYVAHAALKWVDWRGCSSSLGRGSSGGLHGGRVGGGGGEAMTADAMTPLLRAGDGDAEPLPSMAPEVAQAEGGGLSQQLLQGGEQGQ